jgi:hypothetical protein
MQVDFIGPPEEVRAIRGRVRRLTKHGELALSQACPCSSVQTAQGGTEQTLAPAADARADDLPNGGRVFFAARDRDDIVLLRAHLRRYVDMIQAGRCGKEYPEVNPPKQP